MLNYQRVSIQFLGSENPCVDIMINVSLPKCQSKIQISLSNSWPESNYLILISHSDPYTNIVCRDMPSFAFKVDGSINFAVAENRHLDIDSLLEWRSLARPPTLLQQHHGPLPFAGCTAGTDGWVKRYLDGPQRSKGASAPWGNPPWKVDMSFQKPSTWWKSCLLMGVAFMLDWC